MRAFWPGTAFAAPFGREAFPRLNWVAGGFMAKKAKKAGGKSGEVFVVGSKVKDAIRKAGLRTAGDALDALNGRVGEVILGAVERCKSNGRQTIRPSDF